MAWRLIDEIGVDHAPGADAIDLRYPVFAARRADGSTVVVDELGLRKALPLRAEYRTLIADRAGAVVWDSLALGLDDAYGFPAGDELALLRVTRWELLLASGDRSRRTIDLSRISKRMPLTASWTARGTFLVAFADRLFEIELAELDRWGRLLWYLHASHDALGFPGSIELLPSGNVLVADEFCHVVSELTRGGGVAWRYGAWRDPSGRGARLSSPRGSSAAPDGPRLVADTRNHRVLVLPDRELRGLTAPTYAAGLPNGRVLVCDAGNRRVVELDADGTVAWQLGSAPSRRSLSFPRSAERLDDGTFLVADTAHDRVAVLDGPRDETWPLERTELFWPRCARPTPAGTVLVADGRNSRVVEIARDGRLLRSLEALEARCLADPHDVRLLPGGRLLVADSLLGLVAETDWKGRLFRSVHELDDPHSAQLLHDGALLICDSGNERLVWVAPSGDVVRELRDLRSPTSVARLSRPRYAELSFGTLVVADTGNNRVLGATPDGELLWELASVPESPRPWLDQPRWATLASPDELLVTDHCHHRVLRFREA